MRAGLGWSGLVLAVVCAAVSVRASAQTPLGTGFTYQGSLEQSGAPASGAVPMTFSLWDNAAGGAQVGPTLVFDGLGSNPPSVAVIDGMFTVKLDFGGAPFGPHARWLEVTIDGQTLAPRQAITPAPTALFAAAPWTTSGSDLGYLGGRVGIGTSAPSRRLELNDPNDCELGLLSLNSGRLWTLQSSTGTAPGLLAGSLQIIDRTAGASRMVFTSDGRVGIGGVPMNSGLVDIRGDARVRNAIAFGDDNQNSDSVAIIRTDGGLDYTILNIVIGDNPGSAPGPGDEVRISAGGSPQFIYRSNGEAYKTGAPFWGTISDARAKHDIEPLTGSLDRLMQLKGHTFFYNEPNQPGARPGQCTGFVAQEVEPVFPDWVSTDRDGMKTMHTAGFEALAVEALRELREEKDAQIDALQSENSALRARLDALERLVERLGES